MIKNEAILTRRPLLERIRWGASGGATWAVVLTGVAMIGGLVTRGASFDSVGLGLPIIALLYVVGCTLGGGIVGALLPLARRVWGLAIVCILAVTPLGCATFFVALGFRWDSDATLALAIWAPAFGGGVALIWWRIRGLPM